VKHLNVDRARVSVVPNAVDLDAIAHLTDASVARGIRERLGLSADDVLLVGVGRLEENKGFQYLIAALAQRAAKEAGLTSAVAPKWRCVVLGEGRARARLERDIASAGLGDRFLLLGRVDETELHAWYEAANLFVHPTVYEGSSIATLEAMAHRRAIVTTAAGGLPDKVRPGLNGWLVAPEDSSGLSRAIEEALSRPDRSVAMGQESRAIVEREFSWSVVLGRLFDLYGEVLSGRNRRPSPPGS
jgi:glycosyltransferase involved in cell wall biosynthesis